MVFGREFLFIADSRAYPRYRFFRCRLVDLFQRVNQILEKHKLIDFVSQGKSSWQLIVDNVEACISKQVALSIRVYASQESDLDLLKENLVRDKSVFEGERKPGMPKENVQVRDADWTSLGSKGKSSSKYAPEITVFIIGADQTRQEVSHLVALSPIQKDHLVILDINTGKSSLFRNWDDMTPKVSTVLCENIEFLLEENVIGLFEMVEGFIGKFVPRGGEMEEQGKTVREQISTALGESFRNENVLKDFLPGRDDEKEIFEEAMDTDSPKTQEKTEKEMKTAIFHHKLRNFMSRKVKCTFCDLTAKKLGIPGAFINKFMGEDFFDLERKFEKGLKTNMLPNWPISKDLVRECRIVAYSCHPLCLTHIPEAEAYMQKQFAILRALKRMQFEIVGVLRRSPRAVTVSLPPFVRIPTPLQNDLLDLDYIQTCGTLYGTLTLIVNQQLTFGEKEEISTIIRKHKYPFQYEIAVTDGWRQHGPDYIIVEHGNGIIADFKDGGKAQFLKDHQKGDEDLKVDDDMKGTLGCFVTSTDVSTDDLFAVTCYHCVNEKYFKEQIKVQMGDENLDLGIRSHFLYKEYTLDIALIKVDDRMKKYCEKTIVKEDGMQKDQFWKFSEKSAPCTELEGRNVFKKGLCSAITRGVIVGQDFKTKHMKKLEDKGFKEHYNIFIDLLPEERNTATPSQNFSKGGDSGAMVCSAGISESASEDEYVEVISILCGSITLEDVDGTKPTYSYSCQVKGLLDEITNHTENCPAFKEARETPR